MTQTITTRTLAGQIGDLYGNDGTEWAARTAGTVDGHTVHEGDHLDTVVAAVGRRERSGDYWDSPTRCVLSDGSVITTAGDGWDIGYADCYCWLTAGHRDDCVAYES